MGIHECTWVHGLIYMDVYECTYMHVLWCKRGVYMSIMVVMHELCRYLYTIKSVQPNRMEPD